MREEVRALLRIGKLPASHSGIPVIQQWQEALEKITAPVSDEEAVALIALVPPEEDSCFGLAWTLVHLIETAPHWPIQQCLQNPANPWLLRLGQRLE
jgi:hypothetical protein